MPRTWLVPTSCWICAALFTATPASATLKVDNFEEQSPQNLLGGSYYEFTDPAPSIVDPPNAIGFVLGFNSSWALGFTYTLRQNGTGSSWVGVVTDLATDRSTADLSAYAGLRLSARGSGALRVAVVTSDVGLEHNNFEFGVLLGQDFALYEIPFASLMQIYGTHVAWNPRHATQLAFSVSGYAGDQGSVAIDNVEFYAEGEATIPQTPGNPILSEPKVNQVGYLPEAHKVFTIPAGAVATSAPFSVVRDSGEVAFRGTVAANAIDETTVTGEIAYRGDFSALIDTGTFRVSVGGVTSAPFSISPDVYANVYHDAIRAFFIVRSGVAIDDPATGISHPPSHTQDATLTDGSGGHRDLTGGWYNAGDFGKWTHMAAISSSLMMWLYELKGDAIGSIELQIPESGDATPDLLDQARWGLTWLLKMQNEDGSVIHKVDTQPNFAVGRRPDQDPYERFARGASSIDAGDFVGVMRQAARVFSAIDPGFADTCRSAANRAWQWLRQNPNVTHDDPYYPDTDASGETLWALGETVRATGNGALATELQQQIQTRMLGELWWTSPEVLGYFAIAKGEAIDPGLRQLASAAIATRADTLAALASANGHGVAMARGDYNWGSNETVLHRAGLLIFAYELTQDDRYRSAVLSQLDYLLGTNSLSRSFVAGHGTRPGLHPYHWAFLSEQKVLPGWASGGPNGGWASPDGSLMAMQQRGTPQAKCWLDQGDLIGSYASNEGQTTENAALSFAVGYFASPSTLPTRPTKPDASGGCGCTSAGRGTPAGIFGLGVLILLGLGRMQSAPCRPVTCADFAPPRHDR